MGEEDEAAAATAAPDSAAADDVDVAAGRRFAAYAAGALERGGLPVRWAAGRQGLLGFTGKNALHSWRVSQQII